METTSLHDDHAILEAGYTPQLWRRLGFWSSFAISFSYMSVLTGIFANYGFVLTTAGPFGIWTWVLVGVGQTLTALVFAEMAGRIPLTGCSYNWNSKLTNRTVGWFAGWMALVAYIVGVAAVTVTIVPVINSLFGLSLGIGAIRYIGIGLVLVQALINIYGVRAAAYINLFAVSAEIVALCVFGVLVAAVLLIHGHPNFSLLTTIPSSPHSYLPVFLVSCLLAGWTLLGFEGAADVSEETVDARRIAPKGIIQSVLACSILGFLFVVILTVAIPNLAQVTAAADPVSTIVSSVLGVTLAKILLILILISVVACSLVNMTGASRLLFAMARDDRFIGSSMLKKVSSHKVPSNAIWLVAIVACIFVYISNTATALYGAGAVLFTLFYLVTVIGYGVSKLPPTDSFSLGKLHWPVVIFASLWLILECGILTIPTQFHAIAVMTMSVLIIGFVVYFLSEKKGSIVEEKH